MSEQEQLFAVNAPAQIRIAFDRMSETILGYVIERLRHDEESLRSLYDLISVPKAEGVEIRLGEHMSHKVTKESYVGRAILELARDRRLIGLIDINRPAMLDEIIRNPREVIARMTYPALVQCAALMHMVVINGAGDYREWEGDRAALIIPLERMRSEISARKLDSMFAAVVTATASKHGYI